MLVEKEGEYSIGGFVVPNESILSNAPLSGFIVPIEAIERNSGLLFFPGFYRNSALKLCDKTECNVPGFRKKVKKDLNQKVKAIPPSKQ